ncbi:MAG: hypothetical protein ACK4UU_01565 [Fimbriimonadales bacterium]
MRIILCCVMVVLWFWCGSGGDAPCLFAQREPEPKPVSFQVQVYDVSPSARLIHARLLTPKKHRVFPSSKLISVAVDESTKILSPDTRAIPLARLCPGMRIRVRGVSVAQDAILADEIQLLDWKIHLKRAALKGTIVASTHHDALLQVGKRQRVRLQRWKGGVKVEGVAQQAFQRNGFTALAVGSKVEVRGWHLDRDIVLVALLRAR